MTGPVQKPTNKPLDTLVIDDETTYVAATGRGSALGLFKNLVRQGKTFRVVPGRGGNENYCEFFIEEENEQKAWWRE